MAADELEAAAAAEQRAPTISKLFGNHMLAWCEGTISAARLQFLAKCGTDDGFSHPMFARLAALEEGQNAQRSLIALLQTTGVPSLITTYPGEFVTHAMLPSTWLRTIHRYPHEFRTRFGADKTKLRSFWEAFLSRPANADLRANRPVASGKGIDELETTTPLTLHAFARPHSNALRAVP